MLVSLCPPDPQEKVRGRAEAGPPGAGVGHGAGHGRGQAGWPSSPGGSATGILAHGDAARRHRHGDRALGGGRQCCRLALRLPSRHTRKLGRVVGGCRVGGLHRAAGPLGSGANVSAQKAAGRRGQHSGCSSLRGAGPGAPPETLLPFLAARRCCSWGTAQPLQVPLGGPGEWAGHTRPPGSGQGPDDMAPSSPCPVPKIAQPVNIISKGRIQSQTCWHCA